MRPTRVLPAVSAAIVLLSLAGCGNADSPTPGNDAGAGTDAGSRGTSVDAGTRAATPEDAGPAVDPGGACAELGDVCTDLPCCTSGSCVARGLISICQVPVESEGVCAPEGTSCALATACCPGTVCTSTIAGLACQVGDDRTCGRLGSPCDLSPCCPGLFCSERGTAMFCFDRM